MESLNLFFNGILIAGAILIVINLCTKIDKSYLLINALTFIFIGFTGFFNFGLIPLIFPNRKVLCLLTTLLFLMLYFIVNAKKDLLKPIYIKIMNIIIIILNLLILYYFNMSQY